MAQLHFFSFFLEREKDRKKEREKPKLIYSGYFFTFSSILPFSFVFKEEEERGGGLQNSVKRLLKLKAAKSLLITRRIKTFFCRENLSRGLICDKVFVFVCEVLDAMLENKGNATFVCVFLPASTS